MSGVARSRHQLATLLKEAYDNRETLEEKIAEGRRNRKEAGNKYGELSSRAGYTMEANTHVRRFLTLYISTLPS